MLGKKPCNWCNVEGEFAKIDRLLFEYNSLVGEFKLEMSDCVGTMPEKLVVNTEPCDLEILVKLTDLTRVLDGFLARGTLAFSTCLGGISDHK